MLRNLVLWAVALVLVGLGAPRRAFGADELATTFGVVRATGVERGVIWFQFGDQRRMLVPRKGTSDPRAIVAALKDSQKTNRSIFASYDPNSGQFDAERRVTFVVRRLTYDGRAIEGAPGPKLSVPGSMREAVARALARAVALQDLGRFEEALGTIRGALGSGDLEPRLHEAALRNQAVVTAELAYELGPESRVAADELLVESLQSIRAALIHSPGDRGLVLGMANALTSLGAYEEALGLYESVVKADPGQAYWPTLNIVIVQRLLGQPDKALATLDAMVQQLGPQDGMPFHYHRGWTLFQLGRHEEAIAEFTMGLNAQPDYQWALSKRACAAASLGRHRAALADQERAVKLGEETVAASPGRRAFTFNLERAKTVRETLRAAVEKGETAAIKGLCTGYWPADEESRARSPLLPQDAVPTPAGTRPA